MAMASLISTSISSASTKLCVSPLSSSLIPYHKTPKFYFSLSTWIPQLSLGPFSQWSGLKPLGISVSPKYLNKGRKGRCKGRVVHASLFGVGAPEALVIGVVALLVFGPKGLAEVARNLGKTLRAFQPTIKELQEVSREFKSTLEREIGLDEISNQTQTTNSSRITNTASTPSSTGNTENAPTVADPNGVPSPNRAYTSEEYLKITEEQLKASATEQRGQSPTPVESQLEPQPQASVQETVGAMPSLEKPEDEVRNS